MTFPTVMVTDSLVLALLIIYRYNMYRCLGLVDLDSPNRIQVNFIRKLPHPNGNNIMNVIITRIYKYNIVKYVVSAVIRFAPVSFFKNNNYYTIDDLFDGYCILYYIIYYYNAIRY